MTLEGVGKPPTIIEWVQMDFEVESEGWNRYGLEDGTTIKTRLVALVIQKRLTVGPTKPEEPGYRFRASSLVTAISKDSMKGQPTEVPMNPTPEEIEKMQKIEVDFTTYAEPWNVYRLSDGSVLKVKMTVHKIARFEGKYDPEGNPMYWCWWGQAIVGLPKEAR